MATAAKTKSPGTRKPRRDTCERIVGAAAELIYRQGFNATSLDMVAQRAGVNRGSLYYFFRSKKNLALAVIAHYESLLHRHYLDIALDGTRSGREQVTCLAELYAHMPRADAPCCGCPIGNLSLELSGLDEDLRERLNEVWAGVFARIEGALRQAQEEGNLAPQVSPAALARSFFAQIQGAHIIARCSVDEEALRRDCRRAVESLPWTKDIESESSFPLACGDGGGHHGNGEGNCHSEG